MGETADSIALREEPADQRVRSSPAGPVAGYIGTQFSGLVAQMFAPLSTNMLAGLVSQVSVNLSPQFTTSVLLPQLKLPASLTDSAMQQLGKTVAGLIGDQNPFGALNMLLAQQRGQWGALFEDLRAAVEKHLPPNWKNVKHPEFGTIEGILLDEGLPLAWIPSQDTLQALFDAPDGAARRRVIGRRWRGLISDCEAVLDEVSHPALRCHQPFAHDIGDALRDGHDPAAQALAANLLDSILRRNFENKSFRQITSNKKGSDRFNLDDYGVRTAFTLAPVWRAYAQYRESEGDPIPRGFGRHPSAHAVSRAQYSRVNAVIGLMLVTSLLQLLESELIL